MCPHAAIYVSSCCFVSCPHAAIRASSGLAAANVCWHTTDAASAVAAPEMTNTNPHSCFTWRFTLAFLAKLAHTMACSLFDFDSCNRSLLGCTKSRRSCANSLSLSHDIESQLREVPLPHLHTHHNPHGPMRKVCGGVCFSIISFERFCFFVNLRLISLYSPNFPSLLCTTLDLDRAQCCPPL